MLKSAILAILPLCVLSAAAALADQLPLLQAVDKVDINRYLGKWYEIATIPQRFQKGCTGVTATYTMRDDGKITVFNECRKDSLNGKHKSIKGKAWVPDTTQPGKLKVQFFWPFRADYWIIGLDSNYQYAVVGGPGRNYLWILCRQPRMDEALYQSLLAKIAAQGYDVSRVKRTPQAE